MQGGFGCRTVAGSGCLEVGSSDRKPQKLAWGWALVLLDAGGGVL